MGPATRKLIELGTAPLGATLAERPAGLPADLADLLCAKNGFLAFESALLVRPVRDVGAIRGIVEWNASDGWRRDYGVAAEGLLFFAQDLIGCQFALDAGAVVRFDPETGQREPIGANVEGWARIVLTDHRSVTAWPVGHDWQQAFGVLPAGHRLAAKRPFVLGGDYEVSNLVAESDERLMRNLATLFAAIRDLPDGARIEVPNWPYRID